MPRGVDPESGLQSVVRAGFPPIQEVPRLPSGLTAPLVPDAPLLAFLVRQVSERLHSERVSVAGSSSRAPSLSSRQGSLNRRHMLAPSQLRVNGPLLAPALVPSRF